MSKQKPNDEAALVSWMAQQGAFVKRNGRFPLVWRTTRSFCIAVLGWIPLLIYLAVFSKNRSPVGDALFGVLILAPTAVRAVMHFRYLRFKRVETRLSAADTAAFAEAELRHLGYGILWTTEPGVGILRLEASTGFGKERHILMIVADDNRLLIHAVDARRPFFMLNNPRPFKRLVERLRRATGGVTPLASVASPAA